MQVLFLAILVLGAYFAYTKISKKTKNQEAEPVKSEPIVEAKAEEPVSQVEAAPVVVKASKPAVKKPAAKKAPAKKPAAKKAPAKAETPKAKKAKK
jgi:nucleoid-associated protein YgaU